MIDAVFQYTLKFCQRRKTKNIVQFNSWRVALRRNVLRCGNFLSPFAQCCFRRRHNQSRETKKILHVRSRRVAYAGHHTRRAET